MGTRNLEINKSQEILGIDFDGILRKFPRFIQWWIDLLSPNDILVRAGLFKLRRSINLLLFDYTPIIIDGELIEAIKEDWTGPLILLTGRCKEKHRQQVKKSLSPYIRFDKMIFREDCKEKEERYKERVCKAEGIDFYLEDRKYVIEYLRKKGIKVIGRKELSR